MEGFYYHYTDQKDLLQFTREGVYRDTSFTRDEYYDAIEAGQRLGMPPPIWVLKFKDDGGFRKLAGGIVASSNRYAGGGTQFVHSGRIKPIAKRGISERVWLPL